MPIRKNVESNRDPYLPQRGQKEMAACEKCGAVYRHKRWTLEIAASDLRGMKVRKVICPACRKARDRFPGGIVTLSGEFLKDHKDEILRRIRNEEGRAKKVNPLERIIAVNDGGETLELQTTTERFAQRIGREINRAFKGKVQYRWSTDNKFVRVNWRRS